MSENSVESVRDKFRRARTRHPKPVSAYAPHPPPPPSPDPHPHPKNSPATPSPPTPAFPPLPPPLSCSPAHRATAESSSALSSQSSSPHDTVSPPTLTTR